VLPAVLTMGDLDSQAEINEQFADRFLKYGTMKHSCVVSNDVYCSRLTNRRVKNQAN